MLVVVVTCGGVQAGNTVRVGSVCAVSSHLCSPAVCAPRHNLCVGHNQGKHNNGRLTMGQGRRKTILGSRSAGSLESADTRPATPVAAPQETGAPDTVATPNGGTDVEYVEEEEDGFRYKRRKREPGVWHARRREQPAWRWVQRRRM